MGAGKTSVGQALARCAGWQFLDLDDVVEQREGCRIAEIFRLSGEARFRRAEAEALREVLKSPPALDSRLVLALGGGAYVQRENAQAIREAGARVVFLDAPVEELLRRCAPGAGVRPLFHDENQFRQLYEARLHAYMEAEIRVETAGRTVEQVTEQVARRLGLPFFEAKQHE